MEPTLLEKLLNKLGFDTESWQYDWIIWVALGIFIFLSIASPILLFVIFF